jgi:Tol biopolymer transport system component
MQRITWYALLAVVALVAPTAGQTTTPQPKIPQATVRELATIKGRVNNYPVFLPSGRAFIYTPFTDGATMNQPRGGDSTFVYDIAAKHPTLLGTNMLATSVSPQGDRLAFKRASEDGSGISVWTMPIDPKTGLATGQAQRVSLRPNSGASRFSPDGKTLAFFSYRPDGSQDLTLVPATGGPERVLANYPNGGLPTWSADGRWLYRERFYDNQGQVITRIPVDGGPAEPIFPRTTLIAENTVGVSPDGRVAFFLNNPDRFFYRTASGVEGEVPIALPPLDNGEGNNLTLDAALRYTTMTTVANQGVRLLDLASGHVRDLLPGKVPSSSPAWSPDGRRLAVLSGNLSHYDITVVNADGSSPRRYPVPMHLDGWYGRSADDMVWETPWSPDGRFLAFRAIRTVDRDKVGHSPSNQGQLALLDVNSGQTRVLTTSAAEIGRFVWRSDGNAIRTVKRSVAAPGSPSRVTIVEIPLNGPERVLLDMSKEFPKMRSFVFMSDRAVGVSLTTDQSSEWFMAPLDGGSALRLPNPIDPGSRAGGFLAAGNRLLVGQVDARGEARVIKILSTVGDPTRTLRLPFNGHHGVPHPDGRQIINVGKATGDSVWKLFLVPLDGSATRVIGEIPRGTGGLLAPSPDGKLLAYTSDGLPTTKIHEIDFGPVFQAIVKR